MRKAAKKMAALVKKKMLKLRAVKAGGPTKDDLLSAYEDAYTALDGAIENLLATIDEGGDDTEVGLAIRGVGIAQQNYLDTELALLTYLVENSP